MPRSTDCKVGVYFESGICACMFVVLIYKVCCIDRSVL